MFNAGPLRPWTFIARSSVISDGRNSTDHPVERCYPCFEEQLYDAVASLLSTPSTSFCSPVLGMMRSAKWLIELMSKSCTNLVALHGCLANRPCPARADNRMIDEDQPELLACLWS